MRCSATIPKEPFQKAQFKIKTPVLKKIRYKKRLWQPPESQNLEEASCAHKLIAQDLLS